VQQSQIRMSVHDPKGSIDRNHDIHREYYPNLAFTVGTSVSVIVHPHVLPSPPDRPSVSEEKITAAVYAYVQAQRALGKTRITTDEIARALSLSLTVVRNAMQTLSAKGVHAAG
jgi:hypothetical protein